MKNKLKIVNLILVLGSTKSIKKLFLTLHILNAWSNYFCENNFVNILLNPKIGFGKFNQVDPLVLMRLLKNIDLISVSVR